ncbi:MAG: hypothetical protein MI861_14260, partial [Pirellulales bacterium]|nr:hypothetical protein [Pirellulales bacterium]
GDATSMWNPNTKVTALTLASSSKDDVQSLLVGGQDGSISIWSLPDRNLIRRWTGPAKKVTSLAASAGRNVIASSSEGGLVTLWDLGGAESKNATAIQTIETKTQAVTDMWFGPDGRTLYLTATDGAVRGYNTQNGQSLFATSHGGAVNDLAVSANGRAIATAGQDGSVRLWQSNGRAFGAQRIANFPGPVESVAFSPDGQKIIVGVSGDHGVCRVHDVQSGALLQQFDEKVDSLLGCIVVPKTKDSPLPATALDILVATQTGLEHRTVAAEAVLSGHSQAVTSLDADPERVAHVYSGSLDGTVRRWNLQQGRAVQQFNHGGPVLSIAVSPDGQQIASASDNRRARLFRSNGQMIAEMRGDVRARNRLQRAQQRLNGASARLDLAKRFHEVAEKDVPQKADAEKTLAESLAKANEEVNKKQMAVDKALAEKLAAEKAAIDASSAAKLALAEKQQAEALARDADNAVQQTQTKLNQLQRALADNPDNDRLKQLQATAQQALSKAQLAARNLSNAIAGPTKKVQETANTANEAARKVNEVQKPYNDATSELEVAGAKQNLLAQQHALASKELKDARALVPTRKRAWEQAQAAQQEAEQQVASANEATQASEQPLRSIAFSPDGSMLATGGDFPGLHTWDGKTGEAIAAFSGHTHPVRQVLFVGNGALASVSDDQTCRLWDVNPKWTLEKTVGHQEDSHLITHRATAVDINHDSTQLAVASGIPSRSGELHVFNIDSGKRVLHLPRAHEDVVYALEFSPDGKRLASGGADKYLRVFDIASGVQLRRFEGHSNYILGLSWKSDGETIATSSADHTIKLWEAETGDQRRTIAQQLTKHVTAVQFIGDSNNLLSSSGDKRVRIHNGNNGGVARNFPSTKAWLHCVAATPDGKIVVAGGADGEVTIWNGTNGQLIRELVAPPPSRETSP